jgi:hypothetical protein
VVGAAGLCSRPSHHSIELILGPAFQIAQVLAIGREAAFGERGVNTLAIGKQQRVANIEKNDFDVRVHKQ